MNSYELSKNLFEWSFENPEKIKPIHIALYFFSIDLCNRLGWKEKFGLPTGDAMEAIGVKSKKTYGKALNELVEWGFISMIQESKNQYTANIVAIVKITTAHTKALTKAIIKANPQHVPKQVHSTVDSTVTIDKPNNLITLKPNNLKTTNPLEKSLGVYFPFFEKVLKFFSISSEYHHRNCSGYLIRKINDEKIEDFVEQTEAMFFYKQKKIKEKRQSWQNYIYDYDHQKANDWVGMVASLSGGDNKKDLFRKLKTVNFD